MKWCQHNGSIGSFTQAPAGSSGPWWLPWHQTPSRLLCSPWHLPTPAAPGTYKAPGNFYSRAAPCMLRETQASLSLAPGFYDTGTWLLWHQAANGLSRPWPPLFLPQVQAAQCKERHLRHGRRSVKWVPNFSVDPRASCHNTRPILTALVGSLQAPVGQNNHHGTRLLVDRLQEPRPVPVSSSGSRKLLVLQTLWGPLQPHVSSTHGCQPAPAVPGASVASVAPGSFLGSKIAESSCEPRPLIHCSAYLLPWT